MAVVFDEIVGEVESEAAPAVIEQSQSQSAPGAASLESIRCDIRRLERRDARLRAD